MLKVANTPIPFKSSTTKKPADNVDATMPFLQLVRETNLLHDAMQEMLTKLQANSKPNYWQCLRFASATRAIVGHIRTVKNIASSFEYTLNDEQVASYLIIAHAIQKTNDEISSRLVEMHAHFSKLGVAFLVAQDIDSIQQETTEFLTHVMQLTPEKSQAETMEVVLAMLASIDPLMKQYGLDQNL